MVAILHGTSRGKVLVEGSPSPLPSTPISLGAVGKLKRRNARTRIPPLDEGRVDSIRRWHVPGDGAHGVRRPTIPWRGLVRREGFWHEPLTKWECPFPLLLRRG